MTLAPASWGDLYTNRDRRLCHSRDSLDRSHVNLNSSRLVAHFVRMDTESGRLNSSSVVTTREVRWFFNGPLPSHILDWFASSADHAYEHRVDYYDLASARNGVGRKHRNGTTLDTKFRVVTFESSLARGVTGWVEDWMKMSEPLKGLPKQELYHPIRIEKGLFTRLFLLDGGGSAGCEVELADVETGGTQAWSLCLETYGDPTLRDGALQTASDRLFGDGQLPRGVELGLDSSIAYPDWISDLVLEKA